MIKFGPFLSDVADSELRFNLGTPHHTCGSARQKGVILIPILETTGATKSCCNSGCSSVAGCCSAMSGSPIVARTISLCAAESPI